METYFCEQGCTMNHAVPNLKFLRPLTAGYLFSMAFQCPQAVAGIDQAWQYVKQYKIGVDYSNSMDYVGLSYSIDRQTNKPSSCQVDSSDSNKYRCTAGMTGGSSSGFGLFLEKPFKKQGFFYFDWDVSLGARYLTGRLQNPDETSPLKSASFSLLAGVVKPYIEFGITPDRFPDILITMGPAIQVATGKASINNDSSNVVVGTSSVTGPMSVLYGFSALEIVLKRFQDGYFSLVAMRDYSGNGEGSKFYPKSVDGMSDFKASFSHSVGGMAYGFGLKLLTNWP
jgi:hypothetical protein